MTAKKQFRCKVCGAVFEVPEGAEPICPKCGVHEGQLEVLEELPQKTRYAGTETEKNLEAAFAGESQARNKYTYFAAVAKKQGFEQIAALFLKTAENEREHEYPTRASLLFVQRGSSFLFLDFSVLNRFYFNIFCHFLPLLSHFMIM